MYHRVDDPFTVDSPRGEQAPATHRDATTVPARMVAARLAARPGEYQAGVIEVGLPTQV